MHLTVGVGPLRSGDLADGLRLARAALLYGDAVSLCSPAASLLLHPRDDAPRATPARHPRAARPPARARRRRGAGRRPGAPGRRPRHGRRLGGRRPANRRRVVAALPRRVGRGAERVYRQRVAPAVAEIEAAMASVGYLRELVGRYAECPQQFVPLAAPALSVVLGTPGAVALAVAAALAGWAMADAHRAARSDRLFFVYAAARRFRRRRRALRQAVGRGSRIVLGRVRRVRASRPIFVVHPTPPMSILRQRIETARERLRSGRFANEAAISTGIVLPILDALGWEAFNPSEVAPEYKVRNRRVDFALISNGSPSVFVEVKQPGLADGADKQLFEYAFHEGVPLAVLTDGATWSVYVPSEQGSYEDRRAYHLDLAERAPAESAERLRRYLARDAVGSGEATERARRDCQRAKQQKGARAAIPQAWANLTADAGILERLAAEVESVSGYQPETADLAAFLASLRPSSGALPKPKTRRAPKPAPDPMPAPPSNLPPSPAEASGLPSCGFELDGQFVGARNGAVALVELFKALGERDETFFDRFAQRKHGRVRRYLATDPEQLHPGQPQLMNQAKEVGRGYWVSTHCSSELKGKRARLAAEVAGLRFGDELKVRFEK